MEQIFEVAAAMLASLGGGTAILFGLSSWLGKVWANRILEKEKVEHNKEIEHYKSELSRELTRIGKIQDKELYISKAQYDNEYKIYQEIWGKMHECIKLTKFLYAYRKNDMLDYVNEEEKIIREKNDNFQNAFNEYLTVIEKYAPFYKYEFYEKFIDVRKKCSYLGNIFNRHEWKLVISEKSVIITDKHGTLSEEERAQCKIIPNELDKISNELQMEIREYLLGLQLKE